MAVETFTGPQGGSWFDPNNWSGGTVPAPGDVADLFGPSTVVVTPNGTDGSGVDATAGTVAGVTIDLSGSAAGAAYYPGPTGGLYSFDPNLTAFTLGTADAPVTLDVTADGGSNVSAGILLGTLNGTLDVAAGQRLTVSAPYTDDTVFNGDVTVGAGATLSFAAYDLALIENPPVTFNGTVAVDGGTLSIDSTNVAGSGSIEIGGGGTADFVSSSPFKPAVGVNVTFESSGGMLSDAEQFSAYTGTISGFGPGDTIVIPNGFGGNDSPGATYANGVLTVTPYASTPETLRFAGDYTLANFNIQTTDNGYELDITYAPCFASGTAIATPAGNQPVETLAPGEIASLFDGGKAAIVWIGHRRQRRGRVIRIRAGALGHVRPGRDLIVSEDHGFWFDGVLVQAGLLVNGETIVGELREDVTFWHVELERHAVLLAEGAAAESYLDSGNRRKFSNCPFAYDPVRATQAPCGEMIFGGARLEAIRGSLPVPTPA